MVFLQRIKCFAVRLKICARAAGIKKYKSIINKNKKKYDKIMWLAEPKLNSIKLLISKALNDSYVSHYEFVLVNNVSVEYDDLK